ncbi:MAG: hypothetical protein DMF58_20270 [Acidobacteria bacterium]|nr:MAG: hypothetical protein DMF58_20270 [Acidobacteriota bacterium]
MDSIPSAARNQPRHGEEKVSDGSDSLAAPRLIPRALGVFTAGAVPGALLAPTAFKQTATPCNFPAAALLSGGSSSNFST